MPCPCSWGQAILPWKDLAYDDDSRASVDMNIAYTAGGKFVEIQGSAENGEGFAHNQLMEMIELATRGCRRLAEIQNQSLSDRGS